MSKVKTLAQDCYVQTFCCRQELNDGMVDAGEEVKLFSGKFRTLVTPRKRHEDEVVVKFGYLPSGKEASAEQARAAQRRLDADDYGPVFAEAAR